MSIIIFVDIKTRCNKDKPKQGQVDMNNKKIKHTLSDALNSAGKQEAFLYNISKKTRYQHVKSRQGKRMVAAYFTADVHKSLKMFAVQNDTSIQDIEHEAISDYLKAKGY